MKTWTQVYQEVLSEVQEDCISSANISVELSRRLFERYEPVDIDGKRHYQFKVEEQR